MSTSPSWSCNIVLQLKYKYDPMFRAGEDQTKYKRWPNRNHQAFDFAIVHDEGMLKEMLERAQLALLNPSNEPALFRSNALDSMAKDELSFPLNPVRVQIIGFDLPRLFVFDLSSAITIHPDPNGQHLVALI